MFIVTIHGLKISYSDMHCIDFVVILIKLNLVYFRLFLLIINLFIQKNTIITCFLVKIDREL